MPERFKLSSCITSPYHFDCESKNVTSNRFSTTKMLSIVSLHLTYNKDRNAGTSRAPLFDGATRRSLLGNRVTSYLLYSFIFFVFGFLESTKLFAVFARLSMMHVIFYLHYAIASVFQSKLI